VLLPWNPDRPRYCAMSSVSPSLTYTGQKGPTPLSAHGTPRICASSSAAALRFRDGTNRVVKLNAHPRMPTFINVARFLASAKTVTVSGCAPNWGNVKRLALRAPRHGVITRCVVYILLSVSVKSLQPHARTLSDVRRTRVPLQSHLRETFRQYRALATLPQVPD